MSDKLIFNSDKLSIVDFKLINGQVNTPEEFLLEKISAHHIDNSLQLGFNLDEKLIKAEFIIEIKTESGGINKEEAIANFHLVFIFKVENLKELAKPVNDHLVDLDPLLGNALCSIVCSTSRGVLLTRLQGTAFQNFILPVINPNKLLPNI